MKICIPVEVDNGAESVVFGHFGSAPCFILYDSDTDQVMSLGNKNQKHEHGHCNPLMSFDENTPDIVVVGGIGGGALQKLNLAGIRVFRAEGGTVKENIEILKAKGLVEFTMQHTCGGHGHGGGCAH